jgi:hypothetical protein
MTGSRSSARGAELIHSFLKERMHKVVRRGSGVLRITNLKLFLSLIVSVS